MSIFPKLAIGMTVVAGIVAWQYPTDSDGFDMSVERRAAIIKLMNNNPDAMQMVAVKVFTSCAPREEQSAMQDPMVREAAADFLVLPIKHRIQTGQRATEAENKQQARQLFEKMQRMSPTQQAMLIKFMETFQKNDLGPCIGQNVMTELNRL